MTVPSTDIKGDVATGANGVFGFPFHIRGWPACDRLSRIA
jgi:hypothetical protein